MARWSSSDVQWVFLSDVLTVSHGQTEGRSVPSQWSNLVIVSQERIKSRQGGLMSGLVMGTEGEASSGIGDRGSTAVGEGERWLMASANDNNCDEIVDKSRAAL
jgi:hypothetical protein